jgi:hypothetical protein
MPTAKRLIHKYCIFLTPIGLKLGIFYHQRGEKSTEAGTGGYNESLSEHIKSDMGLISKEVSKEKMVFLDNPLSILYY